MLAAAPEPVPLAPVGYNSGVYAYKADQAPRLKNDMTMLHKRMKFTLFMAKLSNTLPSPAIVRYRTATGFLPRRSSSKAPV